MQQQGLSEEAIFQVARRIAVPEALHAYLSQVCGDNPLLYNRILALLGTPEETDQFLELPNSAWTFEDGTSIELPFVDLTGTQLGPYKLLEQIGEGAWVRSIWPSKKNLFDEEWR